MCFRVLAIACVLVTSCSRPPSAGDATITADLACETAHMLVGLNAPAPSPAPKPPKPAVCENCNGTGKVGDGRVSVVCPVCRGSGKPIVSVLVPGCPDGKCKP